MTKKDTGTVGSLKELAKICGVSEYKMKGFRQLVGFPVRDDRQYDPEDVLAFLAEGNSKRPIAPAPEASPPAAQRPANSQPMEVSDDGVEWLTIRIPVAKPSGYIAAQTSFDAPAVQTRLRDPGQIRGLQHLHAGCRDAHVQLPDGSHVDTRSEVFRWLFGEIDKVLADAA